MKRIIAAVACLALCAGCASFNTDQMDRRTKETFPDGRIKETTEIRTQATARTAGDGNNALAKWKATQTEKSQGAEVGNLSQSSSTTNLTSALGHVEGIIRALRPTP